MAVVNPINKQLAGELQKTQGPFSYLDIINTEESVITDIEELEESEALLESFLTPSYHSG